MRRLVTITLLALAGVPAWAGTAAEAVGPARPAPAALHASLQQILARPEYNQSDSQWLEDAVMRALQALRAWYLNHLAPYFARLHDVSPYLYWTFVTLAAAIAAALLYHIYLTLRSSFGGPAIRSRRGDTLAEPSIATAPEALLADADRAAAAGDFAHALSRLYLALIRNLDRHGFLRYDRSRTNWEYLRQVRSHEGVSGPLSALTTASEAVWYGQQPADASRYDHCRQLAMAAWQKGTAHDAQ